MSTPAQQRILVIDDEQAICWAFSQLLQPHGYLVSVTASAEEGLEIAAKENPDLVLLDIRLQGISGLDALPKLKEINPDLPIIVMTAPTIAHASAPVFSPCACRKSFGNNATVTIAVRNTNACA